MTRPADEARERREWATPGVCVDIDGDRWHAPTGTCCGPVESPTLDRRPVIEIGVAGVDASWAWLRHRILAWVSADVGQGSPLPALTEEEHTRVEAIRRRRRLAGSWRHDDEGFLLLLVDRLTGGPAC